MPDARTYDTALDRRGERRLFVMLKMLHAVGGPVDWTPLVAAARVAVPLTSQEEDTRDERGRLLWDRRITHAAERLCTEGLLARGPWRLTDEGRDAVAAAETAEQFWADRRPASRADAAPRMDRTQPLNQILYGPPGTGKTYSVIDRALACMGLTPEGRRAARAAFEAEVAAKRIRFVTFHQAFSYEDFVEGIRPVTANGGVIYEVGHGIFKQIAKAAADDLDQAYVLIIDEINRGNVSGIFGELITLIEDDKRADASEALSVVLPYSNEPFSVPRNLFILGTMNTADRSLAGLDLALRRRFQFTEVAPDASKLAGIDLPGVDLVGFLESLNRRLQSLKGRDFAVGHAYFLPLGEDPSRSRLRTIVEHKILPLLQEYFFEDEQQIAKVLGQPNNRANAANLLVDEEAPVTHGRKLWRYEPAVLDGTAFYAQVAGNPAAPVPSPADPTTTPETPGLRPALDDDVDLEPSMA